MQTLLRDSGTSHRRRLVVAVAMVLLFASACSGSSNEEDGQQAGATDDQHGDAGSATGSEASEGAGNQESSPTTALEQPVTWRYQSVVPPEHYTAQAGKTFADQVGEATGETLDVEIHDSAGLGVPGAEVLRAVGGGQIDAAMVWFAHVAGDFPVGVVAELPYLVPYEIDLRKQIAEGLQTEFTEILKEEHNVVLVNTVQIEPRNLYTSTPVEKPEDLAGLQLRAQGALEVDTTEAMGASAATIEYNETYTAMQQGVIDGYWLTHASTLAANLQEVADYAWETNMGGPYGGVIVNADKFNELPESVRGTVREGASLMAEEIWSEVEKINSDMAANLQEEGMVFNEVSQDMKATLTQMVEPVWQDWIDEVGPEGQKLFDYVQETVDEAQK